MFNLRTEELISLGRAAKLIPPARRGKKCHISTILRWIVDGAKSATGETIRLEAVRLPRGWMTTVSALERFISALTPDVTADRPQHPRTPSARQRAAAAADRQLAKLGF
jgi:hypothetical protein